MILNLDSLNRIGKSFADKLKAKKSSYQEKEKDHKLKEDIKSVEFLGAWENKYVNKTFKQEFTK